MAKSRELRVVISGDAHSLNRSLQQVSRTTQTTGRSFGMLQREGGKTHKVLRDIGHGAAYALGAGGFGGGLYALFEVTKRSIAAEREAVAVRRQTGAVLKSTGGAAGVAAKHVEAFAMALEHQTGVQHDVIQGGENLLLTFTKIRNEAGKGNNIFDQTTKVVLDMSTALNQDLKSSAIQVGKALQDPIKGLTALRRVGVNFNQQQSDQVKKMVQSGHQLEAQKFILRELNREFGGSAKSQDTSWKQMQVTWHDIEEQVGKFLVPALAKGAGIVEKFVKQMQAGKGAGGQFASVVKAVATGVKDFVGYLGEHKWLRELLLGVLAGGAAVKTVTFAARVTGLDKLFGLGGSLAKTISGSVRPTSTIGEMTVGTLIAKSMIGGPGGGPRLPGGGKEPVPVPSGGPSTLSKILRLAPSALGAGGVAYATVRVIPQWLGVKWDTKQKIEQQWGTIGHVIGGVFSSAFGSKAKLPDLAGQLQANNAALSREANSMGVGKRAVDQFGHAYTVTNPLIGANTRAIHRGAEQLDQFGPKAFSTAGKVRDLGSSLKNAGDKGEGARVQVHRLGGALDNLDGKHARVNIDVSAKLVEVNTAAYKRTGSSGNPMNPTGRQAGGMVVPGFGSGDKVPLSAMVEPGEQVFVLNRNASAALDFLRGVNAAVPRFAAGGNLSLAHPGSQLRRTAATMGGRAEGNWLQRHLGRFAPKVSVSGGRAAGSRQMRAWAAAGLKAAGVPATGGNISTIVGRMIQESGGNPSIVNTWDSNARAGTPSTGLMQTIWPTFKAYHVRGTSWSMTDPIANVAAAVRYMLARYGHLVGSGPGGYQLGGPVAGSAKAKKKPPSTSRHWNPFRNVYQFLTSGQYKRLQERWQKLHPKTRMPTGPTKKTPTPKLPPKVPIVGGLSTIEDILSNFDVAVQAGDLSPEQAAQQAGFILADALKHPRKYHLSPQDVERLKVDRGTYSLPHFQGETPAAQAAEGGDPNQPLIDSNDALAAAQQALADQLKGVQDEMKRNNDINEGTLAITAREATRAMTDVLAGQLGYRVNTAGFSPGFGVGARY